jgi:hypothetical protein
MHWGYYNNYYNNFDRAPWYFWCLLPFALFDLILKGISLWKTAKAGQKGWFVALLIINSVGILPLIYLVFFQKKVKK